MKKVFKRKTLLILIAANLLLVVGTVGVGKTTALTYAHFSDYSLRYVLGNIDCRENEAQISFEATDGTRIVSVPDCDFYEFRPEFYGGRVLQAAIEDRSSGLASVRLVKNSKSFDLPTAVSGAFEKGSDYVEAHYFDDFFNTLYCVYIKATPSVAEYIESRTVNDLSESAIAAVEENLGYYRSISDELPKIYNLDGERIDAYPQSFEYDGAPPAMLASSVDADTPAECAPGDYEEYTDSDNYLNDSGKTLADYVYGSNGGDSNTPITHDDIIRIVPIDLFRHRGSYAYVGKEYGFFVETTHSPHRGGGCNIATVGVFDITYTDGDAVNNGANIETRIAVKNLFCHTYEYIVREDVSYSEWQYVDDGLTELVTTSIYEGYDTYYLHDVSFGGMILDEAKANPGQADYTVSGDTSAYLIQGRYNFHGSAFNKEKGNVALAAVKVTLGAVSLSPEKIGKVCKIASKVVNIAEVIAGEALKKDYDQISLDNESNIFLSDEKESYCRAMTVAVTNPSEGEVALLREGQDAEMIYMLGRYYDNYERICHAVNVSVSRLDRGITGTAKKLEFVAEGGATHYRNIQNRAVPTQSLNLEERGQVRLLPEGKSRIIFTPQFSGSYEVLLDTHAFADITVQGGNEPAKIFANARGKIACALTANVEYNIDITMSDKTASDSFTAKIAMSELGLNQSGGACNIGAGAAFAYGFTAPESRPYAIESGNSALSVKIFTPDGEVVNLGSGAPVKHYKFTAGEQYAVILENGTPASLTGNVKITDIKSLSLGKETSFTAYPGTTYYSFVNDSGATHTIVFTAKGAERQNYDWDIRTSSWSAGAVTLYSKSGIANIDVRAGEEIFVGFKNISSAAVVCGVQSTVKEHTYKWIVNGSRIEGNTLKLKRGHSAKIKFTVGNLEFDDFVITGTANCTVVANTLTVNDSAAVGTTSNVYARNLNEEDTLYDYSLIVIPLYEENFDYSIFNADVLKLSWEEFKNLDKMNFILTDRDGKSCEFSTTTKNGKSGEYKMIYPSSSTDYEYESIFNTVLKTKRWDMCKIRVKSIELSGKISDNSGWTYTVQNGTEELDLADRDIDPMFCGGSGTVSDPHIITNERHLYNIRYATNTVRDSGSNITYISDTFAFGASVVINKPWTPIPHIFRGRLKNGTIYSLKLRILNDEFKEYKNIGLFERVSGEIENVNIYAVDATSQKCNTGYYVSVGAFAGLLTGGTIRNCEVSGTMDIPRRYSWVGGVVGQMQGGKVENCSSAVNVSGYGELGGIAGIASFSAKIIGCKNAKNIGYYCMAEDDGKNNAGGIVGRVCTNSSVTGCTNSGKISYTREQWSSHTLAPCMGGIVGYVESGSSQSGNTSTGSIDTGSLYTVKYGFLNRKKNNQARNCNAIVGYQG